jgi:hypothetical protein|tara:strand:- start:11180 stop:12064 length:885 start_codon:yes stop_codon:yes gene_type:complete
MTTQTIKLTTTKRKAGRPRKNAAASIIEVDTTESVTTETDNEIVERLRERFSILDEMTQMSVDGDIRGMVVTGPPGVGKSFGVENVIEKNSLFDKLRGAVSRFGIEKGAASAIGLYKLLYRYADANNVLVLDDCDSVLYDELSLNLLKAALDSSKKRRISWNTESSALRREGIPESFEFKGSVIFITNLKFDKVRGKIKDHLDAIMSRCHYLDLTMNSTRERLLRCRQVVKDGMLEEYGFSEAEQHEIVDFVDDNKDRMREISLRMVCKIADLRKTKSDKWQRMAEITCMRSTA